MAEAADKYVELKEMVKDNIELGDPHWTQQLVDYYGAKPDEILTKIKEDLDAAGNDGMGYLIDRNQTPYPHYYFSQVIPAMTGVSTCFMSAASLNSNYGVYLFDVNYKKNPLSAEGGDWKAKFDTFYGFAPCQWKAETIKIDEETLEEKTVMEQQNDNMLFWTMWKYKASDKDSLGNLKKLKFSLAGNKYKVVKVFQQGKSDCLISATGNGECVCACKTKDGIFVVNWADTKYQGAERRKYGSLKGKLNQFIQFVNELHKEYELLKMQDDGY